MSRRHDRTPEPPSASPSVSPDVGTDVSTDVTTDETAETIGLAELVGEWTTVPDVAERFGVSLARVRQWVADRELLTLRVGERRVVSIPAKFLGDDGPRPELRGTFTVLADGGMTDAEMLRWLHTPDDSLPVPGAPIDSLVSGHKTEVRRRAQVLAF